MRRGRHGTIEVAAVFLINACAGAQSAGAVQGAEMERFALNGHVRVRAPTSHMRLLGMMCGIG